MPRYYLKYTACYLRSFRCMAEGRERCRPYARCRFCCATDARHFRSLRHYAKYLFAIIALFELYRWRYAEDDAILALAVERLRPSRHFRERATICFLAGFLLSRHYGIALLAGHAWLFRRRRKRCYCWQAVIVSGALDTRG